MCPGTEFGLSLPPQPCQGSPPQLPAVAAIPSAQPLWERGAWQDVCQPETCCALLHITSGTGPKTSTFLEGEIHRKPNLFFFQSLSVFSFEKIISLRCGNLFHRLILCFDYKNLNVSLKPFAIFCLLIKMETYLNA